MRTAGPVDHFQVFRQHDAGNVEDDAAPIPTDDSGFVVVEEFDNWLIREPHPTGGEFLWSGRTDISRWSGRTGCRAMCGPPQGRGDSATRFDTPSVPQATSACTGPT